MVDLEVWEGRHDVLGVRSTTTEGFGYFREHFGTAIEVGYWIEMAFRMLFFHELSGHATIVSLRA